MGKHGPQRFPGAHKKPATSKPSVKESFLKMPIVCNI